MPSPADVTVLKKPAIDDITKMRRVNLRIQTSDLPARHEAGSVGASEGKGGSNDLQGAIDSLTKYDDAKYHDQLELVGASIFYDAPIFQQESTPTGKTAEVSQPRNTLRKLELTDKERTVFAVLEEWRQSERLSVWMSRSLPVDMNLPVSSPCPLPHTLQAFVLCVGRPALVLSLYKRDQPAVPEDVLGVQEFTVETASKMTSHLHDFCHCDFVLLPCTLEYESFCLHDLEAEVAEQRRAVRKCFGGRIDLNSSFYTSMRAAADAIASVSNVPRIMPDVNSSRPLCKKPWLLRLDDSWHELLSLFIERLEQSELDLELTFTEATEYKSKVALLEAARRLSFRDRVVLITTDERIISSKGALETYTGKEHRPPMKLSIVEEEPSVTDRDALRIYMDSSAPAPTPAGFTSDGLIDVKSALETDVAQVSRQIIVSVIFRSLRAGTPDGEKDVKTLGIIWTQPTMKETTSRPRMVFTANLLDKNKIWDELSSKDKTQCLINASQRLFQEVDMCLLAIDTVLHFVLGASDAAEKGERDKHVAEILTELLPKHIRSQVVWSVHSWNNTDDLIHRKLGKLKSFQPASEQRSPQLSQHGPSTGLQQEHVYRTGQQRTHSSSTKQQQAQGTSTGQQQAQGTSTGQQQAQGTSTGQQAQGTSTGQQQAQGTSTGQQQAQGTSTGQQQAQGTSTGQQQAQGTSTGQQAQGTSTGQQTQGTSIKQQAQVAAAEAYWRQSVRHWYPNLHSKTYFLPPHHFNRVPYDVLTVAGQSVLVPQEAPDQPGQAPAYFPPTGPPPHPSDPPLSARIWPHYQVVPPGPLTVVQDSDTRDDHAIQQVRNYIRDLAEREQEVMLVLSQLEFRKYLDKLVDPITAAATLLLPRPATLSRKFSDGDFDVLMINARYGLIVGEIKSVGADLSKTPDLDKAVMKAVEKAIKQLNKKEALLRHLVSDRARINITKTLMLPNVTSTQLLHALSINPKVEKGLCVCVGVSDPVAAVSCCLTSDAMSYSGRWWHRAVTDKVPDPSMTPDLYEVLVARFCGPATTVEIPKVTTPRRAVKLRIQSEAVALTGLTLSMLTLYPDQVELVNRSGLPRVFLWGPPGTGKTVVLVIKGLQWGHQGKDVHLVSSHTHSRAAILVIERQLQHSLGIGSTSTPTPASTSAPGPRVYTHFYNFDDETDVGTAVEKLASAARDGELFVIADEAFSGRDDSEYGGVDTSGRFAAFCTHLAARVPALHLWAAAAERYVTPACLREERVTTPVRCPPAVLRQVQGSEFIDDVVVPRYSSSAAPAPTDGPAIREIRHWERDGRTYALSPGHTEGPPEDCERCADHIAHLMDELRVGQPGRDLQYRDIIILCYDPRDDLPVVTRLRARGVPVQVVRSRDDDAAIRDVALAVRDAVTVTDSDMVSGLERRVVMVMGWARGGVDYRDRLYAASRSTSLLVWAGYPL